ncbi:hypothetical protein Vafri_7204 [Volvox africanus]|uniref:Uncharacterized protein n=1 Tax=Volvox africanus TaxID=51714 RepID=A0A8J4B3Z0_9CHLO|nr:hypothetical protein Vafri_7204 [Volvox africanus]
MDDVRSLQEACLRDRQERDQWHHAFLSEQEKCKNLQLRLTLEAEHAAKLLDTVSQRRKAQQGEVTAAISYQKTLLELTALQETHLESVQAHHVQLEMLQDELDKARRTMAALAADLDKERKDRAVQVADLTTQLQERAAASAAEMAALHESCMGGRKSRRGLVLGPNLDDKESWNFITTFSAAATSSTFAFLGFQTALHHANATVTRSFPLKLAFNFYSRPGRRGAAGTVRGLQEPAAGGQGSGGGAVGQRARGAQGGECRCGHHDSSSCGSRRRKR